MHRVGVVPFDIKGDAMAILFVTSQTRGRWILPKGVVKKKETHHAACEREGFEEAGVHGIVLEDFPITSLITKRTDEGVQTIPVTYYPFLVTGQTDDWPEQARRDRHWALIQDASKVVYRADFLNVIKQFEELKPWIIEVAKSHKLKLQEELTPAQ